MEKLKVKIRKFEVDDIKLKVKWINDSNINKYLHYDLPLEEEKTLSWYKTIKNRNDRLDFTIEVVENGINNPVGLVGLLNIDEVNKKGEFYICMGNKNYHGKGVAKTGAMKLIKMAYDEFDLNKIYLFTEKNNIPAQKLFEKIGFIKEGVLKEDLIYNDKKIDRYVYGLLREDFRYE